MKRREYEKRISREDYMKRRKYEEKRIWRDKKKKEEGRI